MAPIFKDTVQLSQAAEHLPALESLKAENVIILLTAKK